MKEFLIKIIEFGYQNTWERIVNFLCWLMKHYGLTYGEINIIVYVIVMPFVFMIPYLFVVISNCYMAKKLNLENANKIIKREAVSAICIIVLGLTLIRFLL